LVLTLSLPPSLPCAPRLERGGNAQLERKRELWGNPCVERALSCVLKQRKRVKAEEEGRREQNITSLSAGAQWRLVRGYTAVGYHPQAGTLLDTSPSSVL